MGLAVDEMNKCILQPVDERLNILYSYDTGKFYLCDLSSLPIYMKGGLDGRRKKFLMDTYVADKIMADAIDPNTVDLSSFKAPVVVGIMAVNHCNLACRYCIAANGNGYSDKSVFPYMADKLVNILKNSPVVSVLISGGEPTLYSGLPLLIENIAKQNFLCLLDTNGIHIRNELIKALANTDVIPRISLDSIDEHEHNYNRGNYKETISNIDLLLKNGVNLRVNTVLNSINIKSLSSMAEWLLQKNIKKWHIYKLQKEFAPCEIWVDDFEAEKAIDTLFKSYANKINILCKFSHHNDGFSSFIIDSEGNCFSTSNGVEATRAKVSFGNIYKDELSTIWGEAPLDYRIRHFNKYLVWDGKVT